MEARRRGERREEAAAEQFRMSRDAIPPPPHTHTDSFSSDCGAPQPPVWLTLVEITWQNQFNVITQPRASSCLRERRSLRYWSRASPSPPSPIYFSQMKMNYAFSSVTLAHKCREHIQLHLLLAEGIWGRYLLRWRCLKTCLQVLWAQGRGHFSQVFGLHYTLYGSIVLQMYILFFIDIYKILQMCVYILFILL